MLRLGAILLLLVVYVATETAASRVLCRKEEITRTVADYVQSPDRYWPYTISCLPYASRRCSAPSRWPLLEWLNKHAAQIRGYNLTYDIGSADHICRLYGDTTYADAIIVRNNGPGPCYPWERRWHCKCIGNDDPFLKKYLECNA
jgi:hypothetical protein